MERLRLIMRVHRWRLLRECLALLVELRSTENAYTRRWRRNFYNPEKHPRMLELQRSRAARWYERMRNDPERFARFEARRKRNKAAWRARQREKRVTIEGPSCHEVRFLDELACHRRAPLALIDLQQ